WSDGVQCYTARLNFQGGYTLCMRVLDILFTVILMCVTELSPLVCCVFTFVLCM
ncbi:hypothetical protein KI387_008625, partial [Taxus chinensis]